MSGRLAIQIFGSMLGRDARGGPDCGVFHGADAFFRGFFFGFVYERS